MAGGRAVQQTIARGAIETSTSVYKRVTHADNGCGQWLILQQRSDNCNGISTVETHYIIANNSPRAYKLQ
jgi:hypothetical protein